MATRPGATVSPTLLPPPLILLPALTAQVAIPYLKPIKQVGVGVGMANRFREPWGPGAEMEQLEHGWSEETITLPVLVGAVWAGCPFPSPPCSGAEGRISAAATEVQEWSMDLPEDPASSTEPSRCLPGRGGVRVTCVLATRLFPFPLLWRATGDRRLHTRNVLSFTNSSCAWVVGQ